MSTGTGAEAEGTLPLVAVMLDHADARPEEVVLVCGEVETRRTELRDRVLGLAGAINRIGAPSDRVVLVGDVSTDLVIAYLAVIAAGRCAVPLQTSAHIDALAGMIADCAPQLVLADAAYLDTLAPHLPQGVAAVRLDTEEIADFAASASPLTAPLEVAPESAFNIIYSSGTTGRAKGIVHSHLMRHRQTVRDVFAISQTSTMLLATPLYSNTTLMPLLMTLFHGGKLVMMRKFDAEAYLDLAERYGATHTMLVPVQYQRILAAESFARRDLSRFEVKQSTGAPMPRADKRALAERWPGRFVEIYGLTEGGCTCMLEVTAHPDKAHTVGRPAPGNDIRVIDDAGNDVPIGSRGEVIGRSGAMMSGYFRNPEADAAFYWRDANGVLYHRTGDIGFFDEDGFLTLVDRRKDVIISGGFNIYASDIEDKLLSHPSIAEAAVIGMPSDKWGETPLALVIAKPGIGVDTEDIRDWVNARLGKMQRVAAVELRNELPRSALGKVLKRELKQPYWEGVDDAPRT